MAYGLAAAGFYHWRSGCSARFNRCVRRNGTGDQKPAAELCNSRRTVLLYRSWWPALCPHVHRQRCGKRNGHGYSIHLPAAAHLAFRQLLVRDRRAEDRRPCASGCGTVLSTGSVSHYRHQLFVIFFVLVYPSFQSSFSSPPPFFFF